MMKPVIMLKNLSLTTLLMINSITRSSWCAPHQIRVNGQFACMAWQRQVWSRRPQRGQCHITSSIRSDTDQTNLPVRTEHVYVKHYCSCVPIKHWKGATMKTDNCTLLLNKYTEAYVKIRSCTLVCCRVKMRASEKPQERQSMSEI